MKISKISKIRQNLSKTKTLGFQNRSSHTERDTNTYKKRENQRERPAIAEDDDLQEGSSTGRHGTDMEFDSIREREREIDLEGLFGLFVVFPTMAPYV